MLIHRYIGMVLFKFYYMKTTFKRKLKYCTQDVCQVERNLIHAAQSV